MRREHTAHCTLPSKPAAAWRVQHRCRMHLHVLLCMYCCTSFCALNYERISEFESCAHVHLLCLAAGLSELHELNLDSNNFTGGLPAGLLRPALTSLTLSRNHLSGTCSLDGQYNSAHMCMLAEQQQQHQQQRGQQLPAAAANCRQQLPCTSAVYTWPPTLPPATQHCVTCLWLCTPAAAVLMNALSVVHHIAGNWLAGLEQLCTATPNLQVLDLSGNDMIQGKGLGAVRGMHMHGLGAARVQWHAQCPSTAAVVAAVVAAALSPAAAAQMDSKPSCALKTMTVSCSVWLPSTQCTWVVTHGPPQLDHGAALGYACSNSVIASYS